MSHTNQVLTFVSEAGMPAVATPLAPTALDANVASVTPCQTACRH